MTETRRQMTKTEFLDIWERCVLEVDDLLNRGIELRGILPRIYEGVTGQPAPERDEIDERRLARKSS